MIQMIYCCSVIRPPSVLELESLIISDLKMCSAPVPVTLSPRLLLMMCLPGLA